MYFPSLCPVSCLSLLSTVEERQQIKSGHALKNKLNRVDALRQHTLQHPSFENTVCILMIHVCFVSDMKSGEKAWLSISHKGIMLLSAVPQRLTFTHTHCQDSTYSKRVCVHPPHSLHFLFLISVCCTNWNIDVRRAVSFKQQKVASLNQGCVCLRQINSIGSSCLHQPTGTQMCVCVCVCVCMCMHCVFSLSVPSDWSVNLLCSCIHLSKNLHYS